MRYVMKQKFFSWVDDFYIQNNQGQDMFLSLASTVVIDVICHGDQKGRH